MSGDDPGLAGRAAVERAEALIAAGRHAEAATQLARLLASEPQNVYGWCVLARAHLGQRDHGAALEAASRAAAIAPDLEWPHRLASIALIGLGKTRRAVEEAREAVRLAPHEWRTHVQYAEASMRHGDLSTASAAATEAVRLGPNEPPAHMIVGAIAVRANRRADAAAAFRRVLALDPDNSAAHHELARLNLRRRLVGNLSPGRLARAGGGFSDALRADPRSEASRRSLNVVLRVFLQILAYFIFLDAWFADVFGVSSTGWPRLLPLLVLALPAAYAFRFVAGLPRPVRPLLWRAAVRDGTWGATAVEAVAVAALVLSALAPGDLRHGAAIVAIGAAILARLILQSLR